MGSQGPSDTSNGQLRLIRLRGCVGLSESVPGEMPSCTFYCAPDQKSFSCADPENSVRGLGGPDFFLVITVFHGRQYGPPSRSKAKLLL